MLKDTCAILEAILEPSLAILDALIPRAPPSRPRGGGRAVGVEERTRQTIHALHGWWDILDLGRAAIITPTAASTFLLQLPS